MLGSFRLTAQTARFLRPRTSSRCAVAGPCALLLFLEPIEQLLRAHRAATRQTKTAFCYQVLPGFLQKEPYRGFLRRLITDETKTASWHQVCGSCVLESRTARGRLKHSHEHRAATRQTFSQPSRRQVQTQEVSAKGRGTGPAWEDGQQSRQAVHARLLRRGIAGETSCVRGQESQHR